jgi:thiamine biosynthesis protein ThiC
LRRLPRSPKVLVFTVRTYFEPMTVVAKEPHVPGRLAEAIRAWDDTVSTYKGKSKWEHILLPYLDEQHKKQVESGMLEKKAEGEYPF